MAFLAGGYLPPAVRGGTFSGYIAIADWYGTLSTLVGVNPEDNVPGLPPIDSVSGLWEALMVPNNTQSPRTELLLSYSCTSSSNASGCDPEAVSIYNTSGDPTGNQASGDMAMISGNHKIIFGKQQGRGIWFGPVYPNGTQDHPAYPCVDGCLFDIEKDPTGGFLHPKLHLIILPGVSLWNNVYHYRVRPDGDCCLHFSGGLCRTRQPKEQPAGRVREHAQKASGAWEDSISNQLCRAGYRCEKYRSVIALVHLKSRTRVTCDCSVPPGPVKAANAQGGGGDGLCITGVQARQIYTAPNINGLEKAFLGPMCFKKVPPLPPPPPPPPPGFRLTLSGGSSCLSSQGELKAPITLSSQCTGNDANKYWHFVTPTTAEAADAAETSTAVSHSWLAWQRSGAQAPVFVKVNETSGIGTRTPCKSGYVYSNPDEPATGAASQGFAEHVVGLDDGTGAEVIQLVSSLCPGMCLSVATPQQTDLAAPRSADATKSMELNPQENGVAGIAHLAPCASAAKFQKEA